MHKAQYEQALGVRSGWVYRALAPSRVGGVADATEKFDEGLHPRGPGNTAPGSRSWLELAGRRMSVCIRTWGPGFQPIADPALSTLEKT